MPVVFHQEFKRPVCILSVSLESDTVTEYLFKKINKPPPGVPVIVGRE